jgi:hypothetical protein
MKATKVLESRWPQSRWLDRRKPTSIRTSSISSWHRSYASCDDNYLLPGTIVGERLYERLDLNADGRHVAFLATWCEVRRGRKQTTFAIN